MFQLDIKVREVAVGNERHLLDFALHRISLTNLIARADVHLRGATNLNITPCNKSAIHLVTRHFRIDTFRDFQADTGAPIATVTMRLIRDMKLRFWI